MLPCPPVDGLQLNESGQTPFVYRLLALRTLTLFRRGTFHQDLCKLQEKLFMSMVDGHEQIDLPITLHLT